MFIHAQIKQNGKRSNKYEEIKITMQNKQNEKISFNDFNNS